MGLKIETWSIAYRKKKEDVLFEDTADFIVIENGRKGWYADPFLFDYEDKTYLFAEYFSYDIGRGVLVYAVYDNERECFTDFREIIRENYHLSYPFVFVGDDGDIYLMPESHESNELYLYKAIEFPNKWIRHKTILKDIRLVDTTLFRYMNKNLAFSLEIDNRMSLLEFDDNYNCTSKKYISNDMSYARAGGRVFDYNGKRVYVAQDCSEDYGKAVSFYEFTIDDNGMNHKLIKKVFPDDIQLINEKKQPLGIHTYNFSKQLEVIDLKYYRNSYYRLLKRIIK